MIGRRGFLSALLAIPVVARIAPALLDLGATPVTAPVLAPTISGCSIAAVADALRRTYTDKYFEPFRRDEHWGDPVGGDDYHPQLDRLKRPTTSEVHWKSREVRGRRARWAE